MTDKVFERWGRNAFSLEEVIRYTYLALINKINRHYLNQIKAFHSKHVTPKNKASK